MHPQSAQTHVWRRTGTQQASTRYPQHSITARASQAATGHLLAPSCRPVQQQLNTQVTDMPSIVPVPCKVAAARRAASTAAPPLQHADALSEHSAVINGNPQTPAERPLPCYTPHRPTASLVPSPCCTIITSAPWQGQSHRTRAHSTPLMVATALWPNAVAGLPSHDIQLLPITVPSTPSHPTLPLLLLPSASTVLAQRVLRPVDLPHRAAIS